MSAGRSAWGDMTPDHAAHLRRLPVDQRDLVVERAAIVAEATGCSWAEADRLALAELDGRQRSLFGGES